MEYFDWAGANKCAAEGARQVALNQDREKRRIHLSKNHKNYVMAIKAAVIAQDLVVTIGTSIAGSSWHTFSFKRSVGTNDDPGTPKVPLIQGVAANPNTGHARQEVLEGLPEPTTLVHFTGEGSALFPPGSDLEKSFEKTYENSDEDPNEKAAREQKDNMPLVISPASMAIYQSAKTDKAVSSGAKKPPESRDEAIPNPGESASNTMTTIQTSPTKDATATANKGGVSEPAYVPPTSAETDPSGVDGTGAAASPTAGGTGPDGSVGGQTDGAAVSGTATQTPTAAAGTTPAPVVQKGGSSHSKPAKTSTEYDQESSPSPASVADMQQHLSPPPQQEQVKGAAQGDSDQGMTRMQELTAVQDPTQAATADMLLPHTQMTGAFDTLIRSNSSQPMEDEGGE